MPRDRHQLHDFDQLLESSGFELPSGLPRIPLPDGFLRAGREKLAAAGIDPAASFVGLWLGGGPDAGRRWPIERFGELAVSLRAADIPVAIFAGPDELDDARRLAAAAASPLPVVGSDEDALGMASLLASARLLVSADSGEMHLAAAVGVRCVALFGPTDPARSGPLGDGHRVIRRGTMAEIGSADVLSVTRTAWDGA